MRTSCGATMAEGSRDQALHDFQACTGIEDIEMCIVVLEQYNWNLLEAIRSVMSSDACSPMDEALPHASGTHPKAESAPALGEQLVCPSRKESLPDELNAAVGASSVSSASAPKIPGTRLLNFTVEYRDRTVTVVLPDSATVAHIKDVLESELNVPVADQELRGWSTCKVDNRKILRDLNLPKENRLYLLTPSISNPTVVKPRSSSSSESTGSDKSNYTLIITFRDDGMEFQHSLPYSGSQTIMKVKSDMQQRTKVPVRQQQWQGWPDQAKDDNMTLTTAGIGYPVHHLSLTRVFAEKKPKPKVEETAMEVESDDDMPEDMIDDTMFEQDVPEVRMPEPLIPSSVSDEMEALEHFTREFSNRYGDCHPVFYVGSLDDAIKDSLMVKAKERKPLAIYLHHDASIQANVFCSHLLCTEGVVSYLSTNFITWAWDLTHESNKARLLTMATKHFGSVAAAQVRSYTPEQLPALLIISRSRATNEVFTVIQGYVNLDELMSSLISAVDIFQEQQRADILEEEEREHREKIKNEQDQAYQDSLAADRKKVEAQKEEERRRQKEKEEEQKLQRLEEEKKKAEDDRKEVIRESVAKTVPDEPARNTSKPVTEIRIRTPDGVTITRRFLVQQPLRILLNFITSKGFHTEDFKVLTTYPRRDITMLNENESLEKLKLFPQETLILEERH